MEKILILGSGPAGYTAGIYTARAELSPLLLQGNLPGGLLTTTTEIENFPGFEHGIQGFELMDQMRKQAQRFGAKIEQEAVIRVNLKEHPFRIWTDSEKVIEAKALIIATGSSPRMLGLEREKEFLGFGLSTCATCDGAFYRNKAIVVVGGGDSACEEAIYLTNFGKTVTMIHRRDELRASEIMQERVLNNPKISVIRDSGVSELLGDKEKGLTGIKVKNLKTGAVTELACDGLFYAIGHEPNTNLFKDQLEINANGFIVTRPDSTKTSVEGVFACGDVRDSVFRQAVVASASGCMAGMEAVRFLAEKHPS